MSDAELERLRAELAQIEKERERFRDIASAGETTVTRLRAELDELKQVLAEEISAMVNERVAARRDHMLDLIAERDALKAAAGRIERLRDQWLSWPKDDMHYAAGLMLDRHLSGEAFTLDTRPISVESPGNDGFRFEAPGSES